MGGSQGGTPDEVPIDPSLMRRMDAEMRREMAAAERDAATLAARRRVLTDVARAAVDRGDWITVASGPVEFNGRGVYARGDILTLDTPSARIEVHVAALDWIRVDQRATAGGQSSPIEAESFAARMGLLELTAEPVTVIGRFGTPQVTGTIAAVARDHVVVSDGSGKDWHVALSTIAFAVRAHDVPRR